ncbi:uncharacterized protein LOC124838708 [Vigna umbellata]|uniref:uncharacterized protein LOC124838708 n=1 Tax=Vigna umbellata TaxID=87088 RepID=UPI001F5E45E3|nr:uncharacterized protein LOC124838708 [Vigna umbellata]
MEMMVSDCEQQRKIEIKAGETGKRGPDKLGVKQDKNIGNESLTCEKENSKRMSEIWHVLKKSLHCRSHSSEVHDPQAKRIDQRKKDERNKRQSKHQLSHEIFLDRYSGEIKIFPCYPTEEPPSHSPAKSKLTIVSSETLCVDCDECVVFSKKKVPVKDSNDPPISARHRECEDKIKSSDTVEEQGNFHLHSVSCENLWKIWKNIDVTFVTLAGIEHSLDTVSGLVIQLEREDSSSKIIEQICEGNLTESNATEIECVMRVQSKQETFAWYEECRELVRVKAKNLEKEQPRCLVDGNELLRFHGTTLACSLGSNASSSTLCTLDHCGVCQILKHGFYSNQELFNGALGVCTSSSSAKAIHSICSPNNKSVTRKCVMLCRVIAGRIHNPLQEIEEITHTGFDSLVKKMRDHSEIEELVVLNPRAVLPCFLVIYNL